MRKAIWSALFLVGVTGGATAAVVPVAVDFSPGSVITPGPLSGRDNPDAALIGPDGVFLSLGFGGVAVFDFGEMLAPSMIDITEVTFLQFGSHAESVDVFVSTSFDGDFSLPAFTPIGSVLNVHAQTSAGVESLSPFQFVALMDTSPLDGGSFDGFDIDAISAIPTVAPIPVPPAAFLFTSALLGTVFLIRRRA